MSTQNEKSSRPLSAAIGARLSEVLAERRISQQALAERLDVSPSFVSAVVRGLQAPGAEFLFSLHKILGVSIDWLLVGVGARYGSRIDADLLQSLLLQVQLAQLITEGPNVHAETLLLGAIPGIQIGTQTAAGSEDAAIELLSTLVEQNEALPVALSIYSNSLLQVSEDQRGGAIQSAIQELLDANRRPSVVNKMVLAAATGQAGAPKASPSPDSINWTPGPLPSGRKIGDVLEATETSAGIARKSRPKPRKRDASNR